MAISMTGYGRGENTRDGMEFTVEIKTVNHRYLETLIRLPRQIGFLEEKVRASVAKAISRGKSELFVTYRNYNEEHRHVTLDESLAKTYITAVRALKDKFRLKDDITVSLISKFPDVLKVEQNEEDEEVLWGVLSLAVEEALESLVAMRKREGRALEEDIMQRAECIDALIGQIAEKAPEVPFLYKTKLESRINDLLTQQLVDENRLAVEVAFFADRCCIDEELARLSSHVGQLKEILASDREDQPVGRKLDFLLQEMNREINTIGSKANDLSITGQVLDVKSEIEKIREQVQNIE